MTLLAIENLRAGYGVTDVLHGLDLELDEGGITALLGANGAGKAVIPPSSSSRSSPCSTSVTP